MSNVKCQKAMVTVPSQYRLPTAEDLPDSDESPVDNELQNDIPNILLNLLRQIWGKRSDWFWGVDMGVYYEPNIEEPVKSKVIVPDGFLVLQQLPIKRTTKDFLKVLLRNTFKKSFGSGLSAKRCRCT